MSGPPSQTHPRWSPGLPTAMPSTVVESRVPHAMWTSSCGKYYSVQVVVSGTWGGASTVQGYAGSQHPKAQEPAFTHMAPRQRGHCHPHRGSDHQGQRQGCILHLISARALRGRDLLCPLTAPTLGSPHSHPSPGRWGVNLHPCEWCPPAGDLISRQHFNPTSSDRNTTPDSTSWHQVSPLRCALLVSLHVGRGR